MKSTRVSDDYDSRALAQKPEARLQVAPVTRRRSKARPRAFEEGDLLALPLCILWGAAFWLSSYLGILPGVGGSGLSFLWSFPATAARYLFGW